jgi:hypothetical protein
MRPAGGAVRDRALHFRLGSEAALPLVTSANPIPKGGEAFRGLESDGKNEGCDPISTRRHSVPKREA